MKIRLRFFILFAVLAAMAVGTAVYVSLEGNTYTEHLTFFVNNYLKEEDLSIKVADESVVVAERVFLDENHTISADFKSVGEGNTKANFYNKENLVADIPLHVNGLGIIIQTNSKNFDGYLLIEIEVLIGLAFIIIVMAASFLECLKKAKYSYSMVSYGGIALFCAAIMTVLIYGMQWHNSFDQFLSQFFSTGSLFAFVAAPLMVTICVLIALSNISLIRHEGFRPQNMLGIALAVVWFAALIPIFSTVAMFRGGHFSIWMYVKVFLSYLVSLMSCMLLFTIICAFLSTRHKPAYNRDYLIILGCCIRNDGTPTPILRGRIDAAINFEKAQFAATGKHAKLVTSGGQGSDEVISESESMKRYLIEQGYPEEQIIKEDKSVNTDQNIKFSRDKIEEDAGTLDGIKAGIATTNYHIFRSYILAKKHGLDAEGISAKTKWYFYPNAFLREFAGLIVDLKFKLAVIVLLLLGACLFDALFINGLETFI